MSSLHLDPDPFGTWWNPGTTQLSTSFPIFFRLDGNGPEPVSSPFSFRGTPQYHDDRSGFLVDRTAGGFSPLGIHLVVSTHFAPKTVVTFLSSSLLVTMFCRALLQGG